ncbi:contractile injection system protein, VgrG/Pvc8 family, partial [Xanthomonas oryzae]
MRTRIANHSSVAFVGALWVGLLLFGVFAAVSVQKSVRDRVDGIGVTAIHHGEAGCSVVAALSLLTVGLCNATPPLSAKIVEAVFADYAPMASWQWSEETSAFLAQARPRSYCVQYRESDLDFVQRLLAEEGLGWRLQEADASPGGHQLVVFADSAAQPQDPSSAQGGGLRYHRSDATEAADSVLAIGATRRLGSGRLTVLSEDFKTRQARSAQLPLHGGGRQSLREVYEPVGMDAFASAQAADRSAELMAQAHEAQWSPWQGRSTVRTLRAGTWFTLTQAPQQGQAPPAQLLL